MFKTLTFSTLPRELSSKHPFHVIIPNGSIDLLQPNKKVCLIATVNGSKQCLKLLLIYHCPVSVQKLRETLVHAG